MKGKYTKEIVITIKKSGLKAAKEDYRRLEEAATCVLPCRITEKEEDVVIVYDTSHTKPFTVLKKEDRLLQLTVLEQVYQLEQLRQNYEFSMGPDNLFYDYRGNVYVMHKDIQPVDYQGTQEHFLEEYKALVGYVLQNRYQYEDYLKGGMALLKRNSMLAQLYEVREVNALSALMEQFYSVELEKKNKRMMEIKRSTNRIKNVYIAISILLIAGAAGILSYLYFYQIKQLQMVAGIYDSYIMGDYVSAIDIGKGVHLSDMNGRQKYALAVSYVKGEDLTAEQKDNILSRMFPDGDEKMLEYWIQLGSMNVAEAEDIARLYSDDELLLYAYLKEKRMLESDMGLSGTEKSSALEELQGRIDALSEKYSTQEEKDE